MPIEKERYFDFLIKVKDRIQTSQMRAVLSVNTELIYLYWDIGRMIDKRQKIEGWGAGIIPKLSTDIRNELPEIKGFSERNIGYMIRFAKEYGEPAILQQPVAKLRGKDKSSHIAFSEYSNDISVKVQQLVAQLPWGHNVLLMSKIKDQR
ncbi:MAG: DUF1016 N-terminal domain-containing protein [Nitrospirota bacterium]